MKKVFLFVIFLLPVFSNAQAFFNKTTMLMGCRFDIIVVANDSMEGEKYIND